MADKIIKIIKKDIYVIMGVMIGILALVGMRLLPVAALDMTLLEYDNMGAMDQIKYLLIGLLAVFIISFLLYILAQLMRLVSFIRKKLYRRWIYDK